MTDNIPNPTLSITETYWSSEDRKKYLVRPSEIVIEYERDMKLYSITVGPADGESDCNTILLYPIEFEKIRLFMSGVILAGEFKPNISTNQTSLEKFIEGVKS